MIKRSLVESSSVTLLVKSWELINLCVNSWLVWQHWNINLHKTNGIWLQHIHFFNATNISDAQTVS